MAKRVERNLLAAMFFRYSKKQCNFTLKKAYLECEEAPAVVASINVIFGYVNMLYRS